MVPASGVGLGAEAPVRKGVPAGFGHQQRAHRGRHAAPAPSTSQPARSRPVHPPELAAAWLSGRAGCVPRLEPPLHQAQCARAEGRRDEHQRDRAEAEPEQRQHELSEGDEAAADEQPQRPPRGPEAALRRGQSTPLSQPERQPLGRDQTPARPDRAGPSRSGHDFQQVAVGVEVDPSQPVARLAQPRRGGRTGWHRARR